MTSPNLSHFYISKKPLLVFQSSANLPNFRLPAPIGQNFERLVMVFLKYNNGSNLERSLLSLIQSFVANPSKMKIFLIRLLHRVSETVTENAIFQNFIHIRITLALAVLFITKFLRIYHRCFSAYILYLTVNDCAFPHTEY